MEKLMKSNSKDTSKEQFEEWYLLLMEAKRIGLTVDDIRKFFRTFNTSPR